jgi:cytochrome P450
MSLTTTILLVVLVPIVLYCIDYYIKHRKEVNRVSHIPGYNYPHMIFLLLFARKNYPFLNPRGQAQVAKELGAKYIWRITIGPKTYVMTKDSVAYKDILVIREKSFTKDPFYKKPGRLFSWGSHNVVTADGEEWMRLRSFINPSFSDGTLQAMYTSSIVKYVNVLCDEWNKQAKSETNNIIQITRDMLHLISDIFGKAGFGVEFNSLGQDKLANHADLLNTVLHAIVFSMILPVKVALWFPFGPLKRIARCIVNYPKLLDDIIDSREKELSERSDDDQSYRNDLLSTLIHTRKTTSGFTHNDVKSNFHPLFLGGVETTVRTLEWTYYYLARNPEIQGKVQSEIDGIVAKYQLNEDEYPPYDVITSATDMPYTHAVIKEVLRLRGPATIVWKYAKKDVVIGREKVLIPKGCMVYLLVCLSSTDEDYWGPDSMVWRPERFMKDDEQKSLFQYIPFSGGPRVCIGKKLSLLEAAAALFGTLRKFNISTLPGESTDDYMKEIVAMSMHSEKPIQVKVSCR